MTSELYIRVKSLNETKILAQKVSKLISIPFFICLSGDIGSGKTTFARFLINQFSKKKIKVLSPTFPIVQIYDLKTVNIWHYDLYRIEKKNEFFNLDFDTAMLVIVAPLYVPLIISLGFDPIWYGVLYTITCQIAYMTPPFGYNLFLMRAMAPKEITLQDIYRSIIPFVLIMVFGLAIVMAFPEIATYLPEKYLSR